MALTAESIKNIALRRLNALGMLEINGLSLELNIERAKAELLNQLNRTEVPDGLIYVWADMAAGYTLSDSLSASSGVSDEDAAITNIKEGDTSVSFDVSLSSVGMLTAEAKRLSTPPPSAIARYRRLSW